MHAVWGYTSSWIPLSLLSGLAESEEQESPTPSSCHYDVLPKGMEPRAWLPF